jgi:hypothetical protein
MIKLEQKVREMRKRKRTKRSTLSTRKIRKRDQNQPLLKVPHFPLTISMTNQKLLAMVLYPMKISL